MVSNLDNTVFPVIWKDNQASLTKLSAEDANLSKWITPVDEFANDKFVVNGYVSAVDADLNRTARTGTITIDNTRYHLLRGVSKYVRIKIGDYYYTIGVKDSTSAEPAYAILLRSSDNRSWQELK
jgi:hypothetical protein